MTAHLDGNMLAGPLGEVFSLDVTIAIGRCASCGISGPIARAHVYPGGPGLVARCPGCGGILLRFVRGRDRAWLDLSGITCLELAMPPESGQGGGQA